MVIPFSAMFHLPSPENPTAAPRGRQSQGFREKGYEVRACVVACLRPHDWQGPAGILAHGVPLGPRGQESSAYPFHRLIPQQNHPPVLTWEFPLDPVLTFLLTLLFVLTWENRPRRGKGGGEESVEVLLSTFAGPDTACSERSIIPWIFTR